jgi:hypothetical protein
VDCWPTARVSIDGVARGETALETGIAPGRHVLTLAQTGFAPRTESFDLAPGERLTLRQVLVADAGDDPAALARIGRELDVAMASIQPLTSERGAEEAPLRLLWPTGEVRPEDVSTWRVDVSEAFDGPGRIVFRRGGAEVASERFEPSTFETERPVPAAATAGLSPGEHVVWGYYPDQGMPVTAEFTVTRKELEPRLARIAVRTRDQPKALCAHLRAQAMLDAGLHLAAYREARAVLDENPADRRAGVVMQHALDGLKLRDTAPWREACDAAARARAR